MSDMAAGTHIYWVGWRYCGGSGCLERQQNAYYIKFGREQRQRGEASNATDISERMRRHLLCKFLCCPMKCLGWKNNGLTAEFLLPKTAPLPVLLQRKIYYADLRRSRSTPCSLYRSLPCGHFIYFVNCSRKTFSAHVGHLISMLASLK